MTPAQKLATPHCKTTLCKTWCYTLFSPFTPRPPRESMPNMLAARFIVALLVVAQNAAALRNGKDRDPLRTLRLLDAASVAEGSAGGA